MGLFQRKSEEKRSLDEILSERANAIESENTEEAENCDCPIKQEENATKKREEEFNVFNCFGWEQEKTPKWLKNCANVWYWIISFMWFLFGASTFAPIIFITNKVNVIFKNKIKSMLCAIAIYAIMLVLIVLLLSRKPVQNS